MVASHQALLSMLVWWGGHCGDGTMGEQLTLRCTRAVPVLCRACCAASYFLAGATMTGGTITVEGCGSDSLQVRAWAASGGWL